MSEINPPTDAARPRRRKVAVRAAQVAVGGLIAAATWSVGFAGGNDPAPVLPDTAEQFSLDLEVTAASDHPLVYVVEQRARPAYRIFEFDPATGVDTTIFTVPDDAIVSGISLSSDRSTLAITYSPDFRLGGSGLSTLDLATGELTTVTDVVPDVYHVDPVWSDDGDVVYTTLVDRRGEEEQLSVGLLTIADGTVEVLVDDAINPNPVGDTVYFLAVDDANARRSVGRVDADSHVDTEAGLDIVLSGDLDLDHLIADTDDLWVAAIDTDEPTSGLVFGGIAEAHGNHDLPSTWWNAPVSAGATAEASEMPTASAIDPIIVYDAASGHDAIVYATSEGLSIAAADANAERIDLIASRAIRFVAA